MMSFGDDKIVRKSPEEIEKMRRSGQLVRRVLNHVKAMVVPGATTMDLEKAAEKLIAELGATPAFKGYYGYIAGWYSTATTETRRSRCQWARR